jgi:hypothetical protein
MLCSVPARGGEEVIYKVAAWDTLTPPPGLTWKLVVTVPYTER